MESFAQPTLMIATALLFALVIERVLEIIKSVYDLLYSHIDLSDFWTRRATRLRDRLEARLELAKRLNPSIVPMLLSFARRHLIPASAGQSGQVLTISADSLRATYLKMLMKSLGIIFGLLIVFHLQLDLVAVTEMMQNKEVISYQPGVLGQVITGIAMGLGAGPMHRLISTLERSRSVRRQLGRF